MSIGMIEALAIVGLILLGGGAIVAAVGLWRWIASRGPTALVAGLVMAAGGGVCLWIANQASSSV